MVSDSAVSLVTQQSVKAFVDDLFGSFAAVTPTDTGSITKTQAATNGFLLVNLVHAVDNASQQYVEIKSDSAGTPTTVLGNPTIMYDGTSSSVYRATACIPIKKGDYWSVEYKTVAGSGTATRTYKWMALGA